MRILVYGAGVLGCNLANNLYHVFLQRTGTNRVKQHYRFL